MPDRDVAARFTVEHAHVVDDLPLWRSVARERGGPILDLGCAAGRVALPLAGDGHEVWALDADPRMLAQVAHGAAGMGAEVAQRVRTVPGDLAGFSLGVRFRVILAAMNTLQVLLEPEAQVACLHSVREHLDDGGEFWFDVVLPDLGDIAASLGLVRDEGHHVDEARGVTLWHSAWYRALDPVTGTAEFTHRVQEVDGDGATRTWHRAHVVHLYHPPELEHLLARAGLRVLQRFGDFAGGPLDAGCAHQILRCGVA